MDHSFKFRSRLYDWVIYLSNMTDLVSPVVAEHQLRTAYIASGIAAEMGLDDAQCEQVLLAAALHDIGALSVQERLSCLSFELNHPQQHAEAGYLLLRDFAPLATIAAHVRDHHSPWSCVGDDRRTAPSLASNIINLADRVEISIARNKSPKGQFAALCATLDSHRGTLFAPEVVAAFTSLSKRDDFSAALEKADLHKILTARCPSAPLLLNDQDLTELATLFGHTIDFRSRFTALHSSGTAAIAASLAKLMGFSEHDVRLMKAAGLLHDIGKLSVSRELLEKPGMLDDHEFETIKTHPAHARRLLATFPELQTLNDWVSYHHERIDGKGYPFGLRGDDIPLGARVLAVADVFVALTEDRPYRSGMSPEEALTIVSSMSTQGALDRAVVEQLEEHFKYLNALRVRVQQLAQKTYASFCRQLCAVDTNEHPVSSPATDAAACAA